MAKSLEIKFQNKPCYEICIEGDFDSLAEMILALSDGRRERKICIVTDSNVSPLYLRDVYACLGAVFETVVSFEIPAGEASKNLKNVERLYTVLIEDHFDRSDLLLALGGGVVGDLTGFAAATYLRGIDFVQIPTTLLSQVDSSIGGKTGVDFSAYKNMVGAFHMPSLVYLNLQVLKSLPDRQFSSGMGEIVKHGLIRDRAYFDFLFDRAGDIKALDPAALEKMIYRSCRIKGDVVERDPKEKGERALLNFGHTIGHAVEKLSDFRLFHGECVGLGMAAAGRISVKRGLISEDDLRIMKEALTLYGLPVTLPEEVRGAFTADQVLAATKNDKKMAGKKIRFILLKSLGNAYIETGLSDEDLLKGIESIL